MKRNTNLHNVIGKMKGVRVLVIGDLILDGYQWCEVKRISPEAPVPIASVSNESFFLGGAANVANNISALGAKVSIVGIVGKDHEGKIIKELLSEKEIDNEGVLMLSGRCTTHKKRIFCGAQQLLRVDREVIEGIGDKVCKNLRTMIVKKIKDCDVVAISDYYKGLMTDALIQDIKEIAAQYKKRVFVDSKNQYLLKYSALHLIKPNKSEAEQIAGEKFLSDYSNLEIIANRLASLFNSNVVITLGADGIAFLENGKLTYKKTKAKQVFDVSGAGDTVHSVIVTAVAAGATLADAVDLANHAAGYVVGRLGTAVCGVDDLLHEINNQD